MKRKTIYVFGAAIAGLVCAWTLRAFNLQPDPPAFALIGVTPFETARLGVVNVGEASVPPGPCRIQLQFADVQGNALKQDVVTVMPGHAASLDLSAETSARRLEVHPSFAILPDSARGCRLAADVQLIDNITSRTLAILPAVQLPAVQDTADTSSQR